MSPVSAGRILVVDDDTALAEMLQIVLQASGFDTHWVGRGDEALAEFRRTKPDLVLLDLMLPGRDGVDVCRDLRAESDFLPAVFALGLRARPARRHGRRTHARRAVAQIDHDAAALRFDALQRTPEAAGLAAGEQWLGLELAGQTWRLYQLDQLAYLLPPAVQDGLQAVGILYSREQRIHQGQLRLTDCPAPLQALCVQDAEQADHWLRAHVTGPPFGPSSNCRCRCAHSRKAATA